MKLSDFSLSTNLDFITDNKLVAKFKRLSNKQKKFVIIIGAFILLDIFAGIVLLVNGKKSSVNLECFGSSDMSHLCALDSYSRQGAISNPGYANFKFTESQKSLFKNIYDENDSVALTVRLRMIPTKKQESLLYSVDELPFMFGFLTSEDFDKNGKLKKQYYPNNKRILIQGNMKNAPEVFDISFALQKNEQIEKLIPEGFFVYSTIKCKIVAACVVPAELGFDITKSIPFYGFACNGGIVDFTNHSFDFSGSTMVFPVQNSSHASMPEFSICMSDKEELKGSKERSVRAEINIGGEKIYVNNVVQAHEVIVPSAALKAPFSRMELINNGECVSSFILRGTHVAESEVLTPIRTDPGLILKYKQSAWRTLDYEIFTWDRYPGILFFDTRNYDIQDNFFRRMAYFVEKAGYKGTLVSDEELKGKHGYNAHDYSAESMAKFFNKAADENFPLLKEEILLKKILIKNGLLEQDGDRVVAKDGGLVSISQECPDWSRTNLLAHEGWHTLFFRDTEFRNYCSAVYYTFDPTSLEFLIDYFKSQPGLGYDVNDEYLMHNEFMAYIMQQKLSEVANYFVHCANRGSVIEYTPKLAAYVRQTQGRGFEDAAFALNDFVYDKYGIVCGNISLVSR